MVKFSVVIPVYNIEEYLKDCLNSVLSQNYEELQIILIDDGSQDDSGLICDQYALSDSRIEVIHKSNEGVVAARLDGIRKCIGEYIICVDGDDLIEVGFFNDLNIIIDTYSPDVICTAYRSLGIESVIHELPYDEGLYNIDMIRNQIYPSLICDENGLIFPQTLWAKAFKNSVTIRQFFDIDNSINNGEDSAIIIPIMININTLYVTNKPYYLYRYNPNSLTKSNSALKWDNLKIWYREVSSKLIGIDYDFEDQINRYGALSLFYIAVSQFNLGNNYISTDRMLKESLNDSLFQQFIKNAKFRFFCKHKVKIVLLRFRLTILMKAFFILFYAQRK